jgi:3-oxoacyl-[acyl-carrier protein] reductase
MARNEAPVAIVTGGAGGIGEAAGRALAQRGFAVVLADRSVQAAADAAERLASQGMVAMPLEVDVTSEKAAAAMSDAVLQRFGRIDALVNNAGIESFQPFLELSLADYERVMRVNATGVWICCQAVIPVMLGAGRGAIVNVSSIAGQRGGGVMGTVAYSTSKGAVIAMSKALAREFAPRGIRVNAVAPGITATPLAERQLAQLPPGTRDKALAMMPLGRMGEPGEIAALIAFLVSDEASFMTGHVYNVDGGAAM